MIVIEKPIVKPDQIFVITVTEAELIVEVLHKIDKLAAIRVARAFVKCDLRSAVMYVRSLEDY